MWQPGCSVQSFRLEGKVKVTRHAPPSSVSMWALVILDPVEEREKDMLWYASRNIRVRRSVAQTAMMKYIIGFCGSACLCTCTPTPTSAAAARNWCKCKKNS